MEQLLVITKTKFKNYFQIDRNSGTSLNMLKEPPDLLNEINLPFLWVQ
jgi:hypothetical protein